MAQSDGSTMQSADGHTSAGNPRTTKVKAHINVKFVHSRHFAEHCVCNAVRRVHQIHKSRNIPVFCVFCRSEQHCCSQRSVASSQKYRYLFLSDVVDSHTAVVPTNGEVFAVPTYTQQMNASFFA